MISKGATSAQPSLARGTIARRIRTPTTRTPKPTLMMALGRRAPALRPVNSATANVLRDSGASDRAGLQRVVLEDHLQEMGSTIMQPPSAIWASVCPVIPRRKPFERNSSGSIRAGFPSRLRRTSQ